MFSKPSKDQPTTFDREAQLAAERVQAARRRAKEEARRQLAMEGRRKKSTTSSKPQRLAT